MERTTGFGARMRARRREVGLTAARLATEAGITENAIRKLEAGDSAEPRFSTGVRIAQALAISPLELAIAETRVGAPDLSTVIRVIRSERAKLEDQGALHIDIFGSVARGNARASSDVDALLTPNPAVRLTLRNMVAIGDLLEQALGRKVDLITSDALETSSLAAEVHSESIRAF